MNFPTLRQDGSGTHVSEIAEFQITTQVNSISQESVEMVLHRGALAFNELIGYFKDPLIGNKLLTIVMVLPNGERESAEDTGGVLRDVLSDFWGDFYDKCTLGGIVKIPCLRHDFGQEEWTAVGRVIRYGWENTGYWPTQLSSSFLINCLWPRAQTEKDDLLQDFYNFVSPGEREVFQKGVIDYKTVDEEDLLDALEAHDCKTAVNAENIKCILLEMAHKELLQMSKFVSDCWNYTMGSMDMSATKLQEIYSLLLPTNKKVLNMLEWPNTLNANMVETMKLLKRYIKELNEEKLGRFLRFCTGSDLITVKKITVSFVPLKGLARRPVAHTCGCVLEIADSFENFMEFRTEFNGVLESRVWVMDIV